MSKYSREEEIIEILKERKYATVEYLAERVHISPSSIRRDLSRLESKGYIRRSHGGASLVSEEPGVAPFPYRLHEYRKEKRSIAKGAARLLREGSAVFLDSSTISFEMHPYITSDMNLTVFTNNVYLAQVLALKKVDTYCIGGKMSEHSSVITTGQFAADMLRSVYVDQMFFSSSALSAEGVITDVNEAETNVRRSMIAHARQVVFLHQKERFDSTSRFLAADIDEVDYIVTDGKFPEEFMGKIKNTKVSYV